MKYNTNKDVNRFIKDMLCRGWKIVSHNKHIKLQHDNGSIINMASVVGVHGNAGQARKGSCRGS